MKIKDYYKQKGLQDTSQELDNLLSDVFKNNLNGDQASIILRILTLDDNDDFVFIAILNSLNKII
jgi:hypothetical protein